LTLNKKYIGLAQKSPEEAARIVGEVDRSNYFAHTIREIQRAILQMHGKHYHVNTHISDQTRESHITFHESGCDIYLVPACQEMDERAVRLILAHELGHLVRQIDRLKERSGRFTPSPDEEVYAWEFAYHLVWTKSEWHRQDKERDKHIFDQTGLKTMLSAVLRDKAPDVRRRVAEALGMPSPSGGYS